MANGNTSFNPLVSALNIGGSIVGSAIQAVGQAHQNKLNREFEYAEAEKQRKWNESMYNQQNAWNLEQWNRENEYNNPLNQVKRLQDAGLNPLFFGLDGSSAGNVNSSQALGYERATSQGQVNPFSGFGDVATKVAQIANIQADTANKNNENLTETQKREKILAEIETTRQELQNKLAEEGLTKAQTDEINRGLEWLDRLNQATLDEKKANKALSESQKKRIDELLEGEKLLQSKTLDDFDRKWKKIDAEIKKMAKETRVLELDIENYSLNHASNGFMGSGLSIQNLIRALLEGKAPKRKFLLTKMVNLIFQNLLIRGRFQGRDLFPSLSHCFTTNLCFRFFYLYLLLPRSCGRSPHLILPAVTRRDATFTT